MLYEFENLTLSANPNKKIETELSDIMEVLEEIYNMADIHIIFNDNIKEKFWEMFVIDSLIGNTDRHNGNWGILVNARSNEATFSPIYDCGSCLNPILEDKQIEKLNETELKNLAINCYSCLKENGKKINYMTYIKGMKNEGCNKAILRVFKRIDIGKINKLIDSIECISNKRKEFYKKIIGIRYDIIKKVYNKMTL